MNNSNWQRDNKENNKKLTLMNNIPVREDFQQLRSVKWHSDREMLLKQQTTLLIIRTLSETS